ncbi:MAG: fused MFS/spermidine synthase, partial [Pseudomonadota bacterium]
MYETVWLRISARVLGNTVYATSIVIAAFMAGLGLGSYLLGRYAGRIKNLLRLYAFLELGIALSAFIVLPLLTTLVPLYKYIYTIVEAQRLWLSLFQALLMFLMLLIPTSFMGGTLPLLSTHTKKYHAAFAKRLGTLYGVNTLGALAGVMGSGFYFIGALGERQTLLIGVLINLIVALAAYALSKKVPREARAAGESIEALRAAHKIDPTASSDILEIGDLIFDDKEFDIAKEAYLLAIETKK